MDFLLKRYKTDPTVSSRRTATGEVVCVLSHCSEAAAGRIAQLTRGHCMQFNQESKWGTGQACILLTAKIGSRSKFAFCNLSLY